MCRTAGVLLLFALICVPSFALAVGSDADKMCLKDRDYKTQCDVFNKSSGLYGGYGCPCYDITNKELTNGICIDRETCFAQKTGGEAPKQPDNTPTNARGQTGSQVQNTGTAAPTPQILPTDVGGSPEVSPGEVRIPAAGGQLNNAFTQQTTQAPPTTNAAQSGLSSPFEYFKTFFPSDANGAPVVPKFDDLNQTQINSAMKNFDPAGLKAAAPGISVGNTNLPMNTQQVSQTTGFGAQSAPTAQSFFEQSVQDFKAAFQNGYNSLVDLGKQAFNGIFQTPIEFASDNLNQMYRGLVLSDFNPISSAVAGDAPDPAKLAELQRLGSIMAIPEKNLTIAGAVEVIRDGLQKFDMFSPTTEDLENVAAKTGISKELVPQIEEYMKLQDELTPNPDSPVGSANSSLGTHVAEAPTSPASQGSADGAPAALASTAESPSSPPTVGPKNDPSNSDAAPAPPKSSADSESAKGQAVQTQGGTTEEAAKKTNPVQRFEQAVSGGVNNLNQFLGNLAGKFGNPNANFGSNLTGGSLIKIPSNVMSQLIQNGEKVTPPSSPPPAKPAFSESGIASVYSDPQPVAAGGRLDTNAFTAAHKTLPLGSKVLVTNPENGQSVVVEINDRGPYVGGRIIDLTTRSAAAIGLQEKGKGVTPVKIQVVDRSTPLGVPGPATQLAHNAEPVLKTTPKDVVQDKNTRSNAGAKKEPTNTAANTAVPKPVTAKPTSASKKEPTAKSVGQAVQKQIGNTAKTLAQNIKKGAQVIAEALPKPRPAPSTESVEVASEQAITNANAAVADATKKTTLAAANYDQLIQRSKQLSDARTASKAGAQKVKELEKERAAADNQVAKLKSSMTNSATMLVSAATALLNDVQRFYSTNNLNAEVMSAHFSALQGAVNNLSRDPQFAGNPAIQRGIEQAQKVIEYQSYLNNVGSLESYKATIEGELGTARQAINDVKTVAARVAIKPEIKDALDAAEARAADAAKAVSEAQKQAKQLAEAANALAKNAPTAAQLAKSQAELKNATAALTAAQQKLAELSGQPEKSATLASAPKVPAFGPREHGDMPLSFEPAAGHPPAVAPTSIETKHEVASAPAPDSTRANNEDVVLANTATESAEGDLDGEKSSAQQPPPSPFEQVLKDLETARREYAQAKVALDEASGNNTFASRLLSSFGAPDPRAAVAVAQSDFTKAAVNLQQAQDAFESAVHNELAQAQNSSAEISASRAASIAVALAEIELPQTPQGEVSAREQPSQLDNQNVNAATPFTGGLTSALAQASFAGPVFSQPPKVPAPTHTIYGSLPDFNGSWARSEITGASGEIFSAAMPATNVIVPELPNDIIPNGLPAELRPGNLPPQNSNVVADVNEYSIPKTVIPPLSITAPAATPQTQLSPAVGPADQVDRIAEASAKPSAPSTPPATSAASPPSVAPSNPTPAPPTTWTPADQGDRATAAVTPPDPHTPADQADRQAAAQAVQHGSPTGPAAGPTTQPKTPSGGNSAGSFMSALSSIMQGIMAYLGLQNQNQNQNAPKQKPVLTITAKDRLVTSGATTTVSWGSSNWSAPSQVSCSLTNKSGQMLKRGGIDGSFTTVPITSAETYKVTCGSPADATLSKQVQINIR